MFQNWKKKIIIFFALIALMIQSCLVYFDSTNINFMLLNADEQYGRAIWLKNNCQSCHQIYGFGGFLGPDLTNIVEHLSDQRLEQVLTNGFKQMPSFNFNYDERQYIMSYLRYINQTGISVVKRKYKNTFMSYFNNLELKLNKSINKKYVQAFNLINKSQCFLCHLPNNDTVLRAPDLLHIRQKLTKKEFFQFIKKGNYVNGMPSFDFSETQAYEIYVFLNWLKKDINISKQQNAIKLIDIIKIPWFEYE